jgi:valyl-tRNA synthetase
VTEELWGHLKNAANQAGLAHNMKENALIVARWPEPQPEESWEAEAITRFELVQEIVRSIRNLRAEKDVKPGKRIPAFIIAGDRTDLLKSQAEVLASLAHLDRNNLHIQETGAGKQEGQVSLVVSGVEIYLPLADLVDVEEERQRLQKEREDVDRQIQRLEQLLAGPFAERAPAEVVQKERDKLALLKETRAKLGE